MSDLFERSGAVLSPCAQYRTLLWRVWEPGAWRMGFVMLNPSTADAAQDDPTIRRCIGFAKRERAGGILVGNISPFRTPYPTALFGAAKRGVDVEWREKNWAALRTIAIECGRIVFAWGRNAEVAYWSRSLAFDVECMFRELAEEKCVRLGDRTDGGSPRHPLMLRSDTPLMRFFGVPEQIGGPA